MRVQSPRKRLTKQKAGCLVVAYAILSLLFFGWSLTWGHGDFPCEWYGPGGFAIEGITADTRLAYCISSYSRWGGSPLLYGATDENQITLHPPSLVFWYGNLDLERQGEILIVNGRSLLPGQTYTRTQWFPALNPWFIRTAQTTVENAGIIELSGSFPVLHVLGSLKPVWFFNPTGLLLIIAGVWLIFSGLNERLASR